MQEPFDKLILARVNESHEIPFDQLESTADIVPIGAEVYHLLDSDSSTKISVVKRDFFNRRYILEIAGKTFDVVLENSLDTRIANMGLTAGNAAQVNQVLAPMPGLILEIKSQVGAAVKAGDPLLILEAMKMENVLSAPRDGVVKEIAVRKGDTVDKNAILIVFEA